MSSHARVCCCCLPLAVGTIAIGLYNILESLLKIKESAGFLQLLLKVHQDLTIGGKFWFYVGVSDIVVQFCVGLLTLFGVYWEAPRLLKITALVIMMLPILNLIMGMGLSIQLSSGPFLFIGMFNFVLLFYFSYIVWSYGMALEEMSAISIVV